MKIFKTVNNSNSVKPESLKDPRFIKMVALLKWRFIVQYRRIHPWRLSDDIYTSLSIKYPWMEWLSSQCSFCEAFQIRKNPSEGHDCGECPLWIDTDENPKIEWRCCNGHYLNFERYESDVTAKAVLKEIQMIPVDVIQRSIEDKENGK